EIRRLVPFCYNRDRTVEQLPDLPPEISRRATVEGQEWGTCFFGEDSKLWLPIPRLITSYCSRRNIAISQLMSGAVRIAVTLMVMAAEIDVSMSVRVFEEIMQMQPKPNGLFAVQTQSGLHIFTGHPTKTRCLQLTHPNTIGYPETFWEDVPKIAALSQQKWGDFDRRRIRRHRQRIIDWSSDVLCPASKGKRLRLPTMGKIPKEYPNYSEILDARLGGEGLHLVEKAEKESNEIPSQSVEAIGAASGGAESAKPGKKKAKSARRKDMPVKRPRLSPEHVQGPTAEDGEGEDRSPGMPREDLDGDRSPGLVPDEIDDNRVSSAQGSPRGEQGASAGPKRKRTPEEGAQELDDTPPTKKPPIATPEAVHFHYNKDIPLVNDLDACGELIRHIRGGVRKMPEVSKLAFADKFLDSALADIVAMARKNLLVLEYELALWKVVAELRVVAERNRHYRDCKRATKKAEGPEADLETARATIAQFEREKAEEADKARREMDRLRRSRFHEVACERNHVMTGMTLKCNRHFEKFQNYMTDRDRQESKLFLHSQACGTLQSLDLLEKWGLQEGGRRR
ncbi:hypothetical protein N665_0339s0039, partial [Sinapis alba]